MCILWSNSKAWTWTLGDTSFYQLFPVNNLGFGHFHEVFLQWGWWIWVLHKMCPWTQENISKYKDHNNPLWGTFSKLTAEQKWQTKKMRLMERCHIEARSQKRHIKAQQAMCSALIPTNRILCQEFLDLCNPSKKDTQILWNIV